MNQFAVISEHRLPNRQFHQQLIYPKFITNSGIKSTILFLWLVEFHFSNFQNSFDRFNIQMSLMIIFSIRTDIVSGSLQGISSLHKHIKL